MKVSFIYAFPLDTELRNSFIERNQMYPSQIEVNIVLDRWVKVWNEANDSIGLLDKIAEITARKPDRNLECFVFGRGLSPKSTPFMIPIWNRKQEQWSDEKFLDLMIHELLHIFISTDNGKYWEFVRKMYSEEAVVTQNHIVLYAMLEKLYKDIWQKTPIDFERDNLPPGYNKAITLVKEIGAEKLISEYVTQSR